MATTNALSNYMALHGYSQHEHVRHVPDRARRLAQQGVRGARAPVDEKAQQEPHCPWSLTGVKHDEVLQSAPPLAAIPLGVTFLTGLSVG